MKIVKNIALYVIYMITYNAISFAQVNIVANPSFELITSCPNSPGQIDTVIFWGKLKNGGGSTPDLFAECCTQPSACGVPSQIMFSGFQYPYSGNNYVGLYVACIAHPNIFREYIQSKLLQKLKVNHIYCVKLYCSLFNLQHAYIKSLGAYFDNGNISAPQPYGLPIVTPQVYSQQSLNDTLNWMKIEGSFVATGTEEYITIGNFFPDSTSGIVIIGSPTSWSSYYYLDDVSVIDASLPPFAGNDTVIYPGDSVFIGRQPEVGLNDDCIWLVGDYPIDTVAGMWVKPDSTTTYILEQTICNIVSYDTVTVHVWWAGIDDFEGGKGIFIFPNPASQTLTLDSKTKISQLSVSDVMGNVVIQKQPYEHTVTIDVSKLAAGIYFIKVANDKGLVVRKFLKE